MTVNNMLLAMDAGNTRTKWGLFDSAGQLQAKGACMNADLAAYLAPANLPEEWRNRQGWAMDSVVLSNVAGADIGMHLASAFATLGIPVNVIRASAKACKVHNLYQSPENLGSDRWAALIAAWDSYPMPGLVINAGTALTIDALVPNLQLLQARLQQAQLPGGQLTDSDSNHGVFLGGMIMPGLRLMQDSLATGTAALVHQAGVFQAFPVNTADAVYTGILSAMAGAVHSMLKKLQQQHGCRLHCIITGGDASVLAQVLNEDISTGCQIIIAEDLVLQGLMLLKREL